MGADGAEEAEFKEEGGLHVADELGGVLVWLCSWVLSFCFFGTDDLTYPSRALLDVCVVGLRHGTVL